MSRRAEKKAATDLARYRRMDKLADKKTIQRMAADLTEKDSEIERLRAVLLAIMQLDGRNDLPDAWTLARAALEERT